MKGRDLVTRALKKLGVVGASAELSGEDGAEGLAALNAMIDAWALEALTVFTLLRTEKALGSGVPSYMIGTGGDINIVRPITIEYASLILDTSAPTPLEVPIEVFTDQRWQAIRQKTFQSAYASGIYFDRSFDATERGLIWVWPIPNVSTTKLVLYTPKALSEFADLDADLLFPPGYEKALLDNLAHDLAPYFAVQRTPDLIGDAVSSKAAVKRRNDIPTESVCDEAFLDRAKPFNIQTGDYL